MNVHNICYFWMHEATKCIQNMDKGVNEVNSLEQKAKPLNEALYSYHGYGQYQSHAWLKAIILFWFHCCLSLWVSWHLCFTWSNLNVVIWQMISSWIEWAGLDRWLTLDILHVGSVPGFFFVGLIVVGGEPWARQLLNGSISHWRSKGTVVKAGQTQLRYITV